MSLLDRYNTDVVVYPDETYTDEDGNLITRPSPVGIPTPATIRLAMQSGTSSRLAEQQDLGDFTEEVYTMRLPRDFPHELGTRAIIEWRGGKWSVFGKPRWFGGSRRTARIEYVIKRS